MAGGERQPAAAVAAATTARTGARRPAAETSTSRLHTCWLCPGLPRLRHGAARRPSRPSAHRSCPWCAAVASNAVTEIVGVLSCRCRPARPRTARCAATARARRLQRVQDRRRCAYVGTQVASAPKAVHTAQRSPAAMPGGAACATDGLPTSCPPAIAALMHLRV